MWITKARFLLSDVSDLCEALPIEDVLGGFPAALPVWLTVVLLWKRYFGGELCEAVVSGIGAIGGLDYS